MNFHVRYRRTLDGILGFFRDSFYKNDAFIGQACSPLDHLLRNFLWCDDQKSLDCIPPLAQIEEDHFITLCARSLDSGTEQERFADATRESGDGVPLTSRTRL